MLLPVSLWPWKLKWWVLEPRFGSLNFVGAHWSGAPPKVKEKRKKKESCFWERMVSNSALSQLSIHLSQLPWRKSCIIGVRVHVSLLYVAEIKIRSKNPFLRKMRIWISTVLTLSEKSNSPHPSFRQVVKKITQSHRVSGDLVSLTLICLQIYDVISLAVALKAKAMSFWA